ncbi:hypothetical protein HD553DRAFT_255471, partial [Filobasidium floriforme]|uniref:uncharacterized protein n=1 Tax=Filobasidium floriforme TaxID=5210 RepID=UPI001E8E4B1E
VLKRVKIGEDLTGPQKERVLNLIAAYHGVFAVDMSELRPCRHTGHRLEVDGSSRLTKTAFGRPMSDIQLKAAVKLVDNMLAADIIEQV